MLSLLACSPGRIPSGVRDAVLSPRPPTAAHTGKLAHWTSQSDCPPIETMQGALFNHIPKTGGTAFWQLMQAAFIYSGGGHERIDDEFQTPLTNVTRLVAQRVMLRAARGPRGDEEAELSKAAVPASKQADDSPMAQLVLQTGMAGVPSAVAAGPRAHTGQGVIMAEHSSKYFTFGLVRRPCDFMLSVWNQKNGYDSRNSSDKAAFKKWVYANLRRSEELAAVKDPAHITMRRIFATNLLSDRVTARYGVGHVHCMSSTHNMKEDFVRCAKRYRDCGGPVNADNLRSKYLDEALRTASDAAHAHGRSVGDHLSCTAMFDDETLAAVQAREQELIDQFDLGSCCSPPGHGS